MAEAPPDDRNLRLSAAVVTLLRIGAGYQSDRQMALSIGISPGQLSRAKRQLTEPSLHMVRAFEARFPGLTTTVLCRPEGDPLLRLNLTPEQLGLDPADDEDENGGGGP